jgi:hypothetical protein
MNLELSSSCADVIKYLPDFFKADLIESGRADRVSPDRPPHLEDLGAGRYEISEDFGSWELVTMLAVYPKPQGSEIFATMTWGEYWDPSCLEIQRQRDSELRQWGSNLEAYIGRQRGVREMS